MHIVSRSEYQREQLNDCYLFICEKLSENNFHRLVSYKPEGSASFRSWLRVVVTNLCIDWRRQEQGRERPFAAIAQLSQIEQLAFKYKFQRRMNLQACLETMQMQFPDLTEMQLASAISRVNTSLTPSQHWLLSAKYAETVSTDSTESDQAAQQLGDPGPEPDIAAALAQASEQLKAGLDKLAPRQRLLLKLRYQQDLSLKEVARLMRIGDPFRARRQIQAALDELAKFLTR
jgi:RNA polymerase sigma factor (sigma-70 family)